MKVSAKRRNAPPRAYCAPPPSCRATVGSLVASSVNGAAVEDFAYVHDALGRTVSTGGDAYPILTGFDSAGRKTHGSTTRDGGATWDETQWEFDPACGVNTAKRYADGSRIAYDYTDNGKKTRTTWARGAWKRNAYNERNLVGGTAYSGTATPSVAYTYADFGKTATATLSDGTSYAYGYDDRLLNTNERVTVGGVTFAVGRTYDRFRRAVETAVVVTNVRHAAKVRLYDSENRVCGYALTNAAGRGVSVSLAYDGSYVTNTTYVLPNGGVFSVKLMREAGRRNLVTRRDCFFGGQSVYWHSTEYDLLNRPTNATDSVSLVREWLYNRRSELAAATVGTDSYGYAYDSIGNRLWSTANAVTNSYTANSLNQYTAISANANLVYDADGNMTGDGRFSYAYDAENRLVSVTSASLTNGAIRVLNAYDHRNRRIRKTVQRLHSTLAPPSPAGVHEWETQETRTFVWDDSNIVLEKVEFADGMARTFEYFWGVDKSGSEQGAGGVGGLLAVSVDGAFYIPCYDHNGNIVLYVSETGGVAAQYVYDPYGNVVETYGDLADAFHFGFSTQYHDRETGMVGYLRRFYRSDLGRWLNRDPIEEEGGENLYAFCANNPVLYYDILGESFRDAFAASIQVVGGIGCMVLGNVVGVGASWTGIGAYAGAGMFLLGLNQVMAGIENIANNARGLPLNDSTPIQSALRTTAQTVTGKEGSALEYTFESVYVIADMASSCYGAIVSVQTVYSAMKWTYVPAHTVKVPVMDNGYIRWTFKLEASCWKLKGGRDAVEASYDLIIEGASTIGPSEEDNNGLSQDVTTAR